MSAKIPDIFVVSKQTRANYVIIPVGLNTSSALTVFGPKAS